MVRSQWTLPTSRHFPRPARRTDFDRLHLAPSVLRLLNHQGRAFHSGRTLQHATVRRPLDHDPVLVRFAYAPDVFRPPQPEMIRLEMDLLDEDGLSKGGIHGKSRSRRKRVSSQAPTALHHGRQQLGRHRTDSPDSRKRVLRLRTQKRTDRWITRSSSPPGKRYSDKEQKPERGWCNSAQEKKSVTKNEEKPSRTPSPGGLKELTRRAQGNQTKMGEDETRHTLRRAPKSGTIWTNGHSPQGIQITLRQEWTQEQVMPHGQETTNSEQEWSPAPRGGMGAVSVLLCRRTEQHEAVSHLARGGVAGPRTPPARPKT